MSSIFSHDLIPAPSDRRITRRLNQILLSHLPIVREFNALARVSPREWRILEERDRLECAHQLHLQQLQSEPDRDYEPN